jgi:putative tricarboxylic transport membrane protein
MILFGVLGYLFRKFGYESAPLILAVVLGPMLEQNLRQSLLLSRGSFLIFISRPISAVALGIAFFLLLSNIFPYFKKYRQKYKELEE